MVAECSNRVFKSRSAVGIGGWTNCRVAHRSEIERQQSSLTQLKVIERRQFHEEVVRVLAIGDRHPVRRLALLEQQWITPVCYRRGF